MKPPERRYLDNGGIGGHHIILYTSITMTPNSGNIFNSRNKPRYGTCGSVCREAVKGGAVLTIGAFDCMAICVISLLTVTSSSSGTASLVSGARRALL